MAREIGFDYHGSYGDDAGPGDHNMTGASSAGICVSYKAL